MRKSSGRREQHPSRFCPRPDATKSESIPEGSGDFREASDWLSHGKPSAWMAFSLPQSGPCIRPASPTHPPAPPHCSVAPSCIKHLSDPGRGVLLLLPIERLMPRQFREEARRDSREPGITREFFSAVASTSEENQVRRLNQHQSATPVRSVDRRGIRLRSPVSFLR